MLDLVFAVDDSYKWHRENMSRNKSHYSSLMARLGPHYAAYIQDDVGANIYYNTLVPTPPELAQYTDCSHIKYGVIDSKNLILDLTSWSTLYVAGRLHKPVRILQHNTDIQNAAKANLTHAVNVALLLLPPTFTNVELYTTIAGLSYAGDVRMGLAENPHKVSNIVHGSLARFESLYAEVIAASAFIRKDLGVHDGSGLNTTISSDFVLTGTTGNGHNRQVYVNLASDNVDAIVDSMPQNLKSMLTGSGGGGTSRSVNIVGSDVKEKIQSIVGRTSFSQSAKGILTAGFTKSVQYVGEKVGKMRNAKK
jgi:translocator assembly and maintenance protein 41